MRVVAIVQARMGSTRLPGKVLKPLSGKPALQVLLERLNKSKCLNDICVAIPHGTQDDILYEFLVSMGVKCFRGSEFDVLDRYYQAACEMSAEVIVRITGDCPLIDPSVVDAVINLYSGSSADYASNLEPPSFPDGIDVEVFSISALKDAYLNAKSRSDREHVTPFMRHGQFKRINFSNTTDESRWRLTLDHSDDFELLSEIFRVFEPDIFFSVDAAVEHLKEHQDLAHLNGKHTRNEGMKDGSGQKLWSRAKKVIPGGNMLLSKRSELHLPSRWPAYFSRTRGCRVWDLDGNELIDTYYMGVGTNILGYSHPEVDAAVHEVISNGNMSTLNAPEEVFLAEYLIQLNSWAGSVRFARSGGEANSIAVRIARAYSGKDGIAVCGYHGWHDWYLSANLGAGDNLSDHLLPGLNAFGVPKALRGSIFTFNYNDLNALTKIVQNQDIGVIKMEVMRSVEPDNGFLQKIRKLCDDNNIILIFDECTSGFRETFGGLHLKYGVEPDIAVFGKTLGNGYAVSAVVGRYNIMQAAQSTFISSTFWTERIGSAAGLQTLKVMEKTDPWTKITSIGNQVRSIWQKLADVNGLKIQINGLPALSNFKFESVNHLTYKTYITQQMLKNNFLAGTAFYACTEHSQEILDEYEHKLRPVFQVIGDCERGRDVESLLDNEVCQDGFIRLN